MATRTIRTGVGSYQRASDGVWEFGMYGDEIDVHKDDLERFDRLNGPEPEEPEEADSDPEASFLQEDIDAAVKAAVETKDAELAEAKKVLGEKDAELAAAKKAADEAATSAAAELESVKAELAAAQASAKTASKK